MAITNSQLTTNNRQPKLLLILFLFLFLFPFSFVSAEIPQSARGKQCFVFGYGGAASLFPCENPPAQVVGRDCVVCGNPSNGQCPTPISTTNGGGTTFICEVGTATPPPNNPPPTSLGYIPLAPLPGDTPGQPIKVTDYIPKVFRLAIAVAGALAVIMITIGGIEYITSETINGKKDGKEKITNALVGLLLAIGSWIILNTIAPDRFTQFDLSTIRTPPQITTATTTPPSPGSWPSDQGVRQRLGLSGISINNSNCTYIGQVGCTSVYGLRENIISGLEQLVRDCFGQCNIVITGGTEWWLHGNRIDINSTQHRPGGNAVDLSKNDSVLNNFIMRFPKIGSATGGNGCATGQGYNVGGKIYVDEISSGASTGPHWHIC